MLIAEKWANKSSPPSFGVINPKPFASLNHLTVPVAMTITPCIKQGSPLQGLLDEAEIFGCFACLHKGGAGRFPAMEIIIFHWRWGAQSTSRSESLHV